jgi:PAS domain S-box-containing protein
MAGPPVDTAAARLSVLHEIALALSGELDRRRLYEGIVQGARRLLGVPCSAVLSWDRGREELVTEAASGNLPQLSLPPGELPLCEGRAFLDRRTVSLDDYATAPRAPTFARELSLGAAAATPLVREGEALGVLFAAQTERGRRFDPGDLRVLEILAGHVALALANADTMATAARRLARAEELAQTLRGIVEARDRDTIAQRALDCATTVLGADRAALFLVDATIEVTFIAGRRLSRGYLDHVARNYRRSVGGLLPLTRSALFVADLRTDPRTRVLHEIAEREGIRSAMIMPLFHRNEIAGALALYHDLVWTYEADEMAQVRALADQVALALGSAALHQQTTRQLAQLRVLDAVVRAASDPGSEVERCQRGVQAIVAGAGATRAWVVKAQGDELSVVAEAGASALAESIALFAGRAALRALRATAVEAGSETLVAAPIAHHDLVYGALVLAPPRVAPSEPRPATVMLQYAEDKDLPEARHEFASTAAGQLGSAIANARLYDSARTLGIRLAAVIAGMPDGIVVLDERDRVVFFNRVVQEIYGFEGRDLKGWSTADFVRESAACFDDPATPLEIARRVAEERYAVNRFEYEVARPRRRVIERMAAPVIARDGLVLGQVVLFHDLTHLRETERAKDHFLSIASGALREPLDAAKESARDTRRALSRDGHADAAARIDRLEGRLERLSLLLDELTDMTLMESGRLELSPSRFDYVSLVEEVVIQARRGAERHTIELRIPHRSAMPIHGDRGRLGRVLMHLMANAVKFSPAGGELVIDVDADDRHVTTSVADRGIGVPSGERTAVFERFARGSNAAGQGMGLGLFIARDVVLRHGGDIRIEDRPEGGSVAVFRIPLEPAAIAALDGSSPAPSPPERA